MNYDEMPAGREMDALIAEKVMGIPESLWCSECQHHSTDEYETYIENGKRHEYGWCYTCGKVVGESIKSPERYSTSISAAWEVVEEIIKRNGEMPETTGFSVKYDWRGHAGEWIWRAGWKFDDYDTGENWFLSSYADTAPLAICRAALKAVEK